VRRVEALTGPASADLFRHRTEELRAIADALRVPEHEALDAVRKLSEQVRELRKGDGGGKGGPAPEAAEALVASAADVSGVRVVTEVVEAPDAQALLDLSDRVKQTLGEAAVVLGTATDGRVHLVANVAPSAVARGVRADEVVRAAAKVVGGGGGGRDTMAQAGGRDPHKLPEAIATARAEIERALG